MRIYENRIAETDFGGVTRYCGELALAAIAEAGNYKARMVDLIDAASPVKGKVG